MESILNVECSRAITNWDLPIDCNLLEELQNNQYLQQQDQLRAETNPAIKDALKQKMPVLLPSGRFKETKNAKGLIKHSGFIAIDIDFKDNQHITNYSDLKKELCKLKEVAYCGLSVGGKGYWLLIPIADPSKHELHYKYVLQFFASKGIKADRSCKNVGRSRYYSYDPDAYFNHDAEPLQSYYEPPIKVPKKVYQNKYNGQGNPVSEQYNESRDFIDVLIKHGWKIYRETGSKTYFTRPGKMSDISAEYESSLKSFYVFSSNAQPFEPDDWYSPFQVYSMLEHAGDGSKAAKALMPQRSKITLQAQTIQPVFKRPVTMVALPRPPIEPERSVYSPDQLISMAQRHFANSHIDKTNPGAKVKYFNAWAQDMASILYGAGITQRFFLNRVLTQTS